MFTRIVKFKCGRYGVRRWSLFGRFEYKDLSSSGSAWWELNSQFIDDCKAPFNTAINVIDKGRPLSKKEIKNTRLITALKGEYYEHR